MREVPITIDAAQTISLNILPDCKTLLHNITKSFEFTKRFCDILRDGFSDKTTLFVVPFISDLDGNTPLHNSLYGDNMTNPRVVEYFLRELLPNMPLDHHGRAIVNCIPDMIDR